MTAPTLTPVETVDCLMCDGAGFVWVTDPRDRDDLVEATCTVCKGDGVVPADQVATCACCSGRYWLGEGCEHGPEPLCTDCKGTCTDCVDEIRAEAAESYAHEQRVLAGGGWS